MVLSFMVLPLIRQRNIRIQKLQQLKVRGINPYPVSAHKTHSNSTIVNEFNKLEGERVSVAGRIMLMRSFGKLKFWVLEDESGRLQIVIRKGSISEDTNSRTQALGWKDLELIDRGDIVEATGIVGKTQRGEISVFVNELRILSKTLRPLPEKWHGLKDEEQRVRRRYLDMLMNPKIRERMKRRGMFWAAVRDFLVNKGFVEINIPVLEHVPGGADAKPFVTYYDALDETFYLRISHELPLKRLLGAGFEKVFDIGPRFRNEGFSPEHLPEHVAMEWYWAYADQEDGINLTEEMFLYIVDNVYGKRRFEVGDFTVDFNIPRPWPRISMPDVIASRFKVDIFKDPVDRLYAKLREAGVDLGEDQINRNRVVDNLWKVIRKEIAGPVFLVDVPKFMSPLAKPDPKRPEIALRFHLVAAGSELTNAYAELNDPLLQLEHFVEQQRLREQGDEEAQFIDIDFVEMLEWGMPPAVGFGLSERVFWILEGVTAREGVPFPPYRYDLDKATREIYKDILRYIDKQAIKKQSIKNSAK